MAGGNSTRLYPATLAVNKQLLAIYDKPMIYYPLSVLMLAGIREILIISSPQYLGPYRRLFGDGARLGLDISYVEQAKPEGLAQAFTLGRDFIAGEQVAFILGDNLFFGAGMRGLLAQARDAATGATIFTYPVRDPRAYGVVDFDAEGRPVGIEEKPAEPRSDQAITGLYFFDGRAPDFAAGLKPSARGELEITDLIRIYMETGELQVVPMGRGYAWLDTGTPDALLDAAEFVRAIERRQGMQIACLEEIAYHNGFIDRAHLLDCGHAMEKTDYGRYLLNLAGEVNERQ